MKKLALALLLCIPFIVHSQITSCYTEAFYSDDGSLADYPEGHTTYRLYVDLESPQDYLQSVFGAGDNPMMIGTNNNSLWNSSFGGTTAESIIPGFFGLFPSLEFDSMVTIGKTDQSSLGSQIIAIETLPGNALENAFGTSANPYGVNANVIDGAWTSADQSEINHYGIGSNNQVLIAQITTDGCPIWEVNLQLYHSASDLIMHLVWDSENVDPDAVIPQFDGSSLGLQQTGGILGCTAADACNYDSTATCDDGSCELGGCTDTTASNYDSTAACDDGSCMTVDGDLDGDGVVSIADLLILLSDMGCVGLDCTGDLNNSGGVDVADLLLFLGYL